MTDILDLPGWKALSASTEDGRLVIEGEYTKQPDACQLCGVIGALYKHGPRAITFMDSPVRGSPARVAAKVQRYKCRECGGTFLQPLEGVEVERRMTKRCLQYIQEQCLRDTFQRVAEHLGCDEKTVRNVASDYIDAKHEAYKPYLPEWIGLDETHLNKVMRAIITDVDKNRPVDLLPDRDKPTLMAWFGQFPDRSHVKGLTIDMWGPYRDVAGLMFKDLPVVIDKFHVVKKANESIERTRVRLGKTQTAGVRRNWMRSKALLRMRYRDLSEKQRFNLDMWLANEPEVAEAYRLKERLYDIYEMPKRFAIKAFDSYPETVPAGLKKDFHELTRAMKNWRKEILNYFDHPITNAYTEAVNGVAKVENRMGRGYSFEVIRARILFNERLPSARTQRAKVAASKTKEKPMTRCEWCLGLFTFIERHESGGRIFTVCPTCHRRFHMEEGFSHGLPSTT